MTTHDSRTALTTPAIPRPRASQDDTVEPEGAAEQAAAHTSPPTVGEFPWPEPWHSSRVARPRSEYWDVATARWHSRGPVFRPRQG
ncbi:MAG: hypothetical protein JWQ37_1638 [Blastococcus sp.]|nr:hypothetical protein [Blastococcus sp.]